MYHTFERVRDVRNFPGCSKSPFSLMHAEIRERVVMTEPVTDLRDAA
jgi:hypothetical protein